MTTLTRTLLTAAAACVLGVSMAHAQSHDHRGDQRYGQRQDQRHDQRGAQRPYAQPPQHAHRPNGPDYRPGQARPPAYRPGPPGYQVQRGAGPGHNWYRGGRMPAAYRTHHYVVNDWRSHRLSTPPRGYSWVQNGGDYLLVAMATGVIAQIVLSY